ncbi:hypothetical protein [Lyngbya confervoides]|uniref:Chromosome partition protein Smc n=1 Tax=Lyngbya confervoides BDU141951 TaxID=1574623 RepID=A0ABD4T6V2_9CYAN|nr:hypothetical protein [Lyngbya confervoides]MCM1984191.1 hypothetical protein [Lyngbya confervoides BDU141951]
MKGATGLAKNTPDQEFESLKQRCNVLFLVELISALSSIGGTIAAIVWNQVAFAASPLTLSVCLNLYSRALHDRLTMHTATADLIEAQRQYASKLQSMRSEFLGAELLDEEGSENFERGERFQELASKVQQLESFLEIQGSDFYSQGGALNQEVGILRNHQLEMAETIEGLTQRLEGQAAPSAVQTELQEDVARLSAAIYELEQRVVQSNVGPEATEFSQSLDLQAEMGALLHPLQDQVVALEHRLNELSHSASEPQPSSYDEQAVQARIESFVTPLQSQLSDLENRLGEMAATPAPEAQDGGAAELLVQLQTDVSTLQEALDQSLHQISTEVTHLQGAIQDSHQQLDEIHHRLDAVQKLAQETSQAANPDATQARIDAANASVREQYEAIAGKLGELNTIQDRLNQLQEATQASANALSREGLQAELDAVNRPIYDQLAALQAQAEQSSADLQPEIQRAMGPLQGHLESLDHRMTQLSEQSQDRATQDQLHGVQQQIQALEARLTGLSSQAPEQAEQINQLQGQIATLQSRVETVAQQVSGDLSRIPQLVEQQVEQRVSGLEGQLGASLPENPQDELDEVLRTLNF